MGLSHGAVDERKEEVASVGRRLNANGKIVSASSHSCSFIYLSHKVTADSHLVSATTMAFSGKYELESQENYEEFLEAIGMLVFLSTHKPYTASVCYD